jgi:hypothetical protein
MSNKGCILQIHFLSCLIDTFPGWWCGGGGNSDYKVTSVAIAIAIASLTELGKIDPLGQGASPIFFLTPNLIFKNPMITPSGRKASVGEEKREKKS